jgi:hypothetical protein
MAFASRRGSAAQSIRVGPVTLVLALLVAACGSTSPPTGPTPSTTQSTSATAGSSLPTSAGPVQSPGAAAVTLANDRTIPFPGPRPTVARLLRDYQYGNPPLSIDPAAGPLDWRLAHPSAAVEGYPGTASVLPGGQIDLHIRSLGGPVRLDVFRVGRDDAEHLLTVARVPASTEPLARPDPATGLVEERWPVSTTLAIPASWRSGVYLVKLTAASSAQGYIPFVVRPATPQPVLVLLPTMTYQAYNPFGGADLYGWPGGPHPRSYVVSFDRPYQLENGAGLLFRLDFPLIVWLEDHGYAPAYATDADVAADPALVTGARAVIVSGHSEYWTAAIHNTFDAAVAAGTSILNFGANTAWWQARLTADRAGVADRTIVEYKDARFDPLAARDPQAATTRFTELPQPRPARDLFGEAYGGIVAGLRAMNLGPDIARFAPSTGLVPGEQLPGLIGDEVDLASTQPGALILASTPVHLRGRGDGQGGASVWLTPSGSHAFDAGTFDWSWGLDPRYAAALPGFPAAAFQELTAIILAWAGVIPSG